MTVSLPLPTSAWQPRIGHESRWSWVRPEMPVKPTTRYARSGDVNIAYQVAGDGPFDLVFLPSWVTNVEENWEEPSYARFLTRLASFSRLIVIDKRGTGLSDRVLPSAMLEERIDDVRAVMDAAGSERAAVFGITEGGAMCALFAATYPARTLALVMHGAYARRLRSPDYPWGPDIGERQEQYNQIMMEWGGPALLDWFARSKLDDAAFRDWWAGNLRRGASPGAALALTTMNTDIDVRRVLPTIRVPTLVLHRSGDPLCPVEGGRYIANQVPGARYVEFAGVDHLPFVGASDAIVDEIQQFLTGVPAPVEVDRVLTTVLFADIVDSTGCASALGDRRWRDLLTTFRVIVGEELARFRGQERSSSGDGFLATFDGPARAIRCGRAISDAVRALGIEVRVGMHTGECELMGDDVGGIAVHIGARVAGIAQPGEILVSRTVKDLVAGSGIAFTDRGQHTLRGVPGLWHVFSVVRSP